MNKQSFHPMLINELYCPDLNKKKTIFPNSQEIFPGCFFWNLENIICHVPEILNEAIL